MPQSVRKFLQPALYLFVLTFCSVGVVSAQQPTMKPAPIFGSSFTADNPFADISVTVAGVPNGAFKSALLAVFANDASITVFNDKIYIAYVDKETQGLNVVVAEPIPGQPNYTLKLFHQETAFKMTSSPTMSVYRGYLVIYFAAQAGTVPNGFFGVGFDGKKWLNMREVASF